MTQEKLEQRAWEFVAADKSRIPVTSLQTSIEWCRAELKKAAEIAESQLHTDRDCCCHAANRIGEAIRKLME